MARLRFPTDVGREARRDKAVRKGHRAVLAAAPGAWQIARRLPAARFPSATLSAVHATRGQKVAKSRKPAISDGCGLWWRVSDEVRVAPVVYLGGQHQRSRIAEHPMQALGIRRLQWRQR